MPYADPVSLRETLSKYYDDEELRTLCFDLSIDYDSLGGHGKANNARALVAFAQRYDRYDELTAYVRRTRPQAKLAMVEMLPPLADASDGNSALLTFPSRGLHCRSATHDPTHEAVHCTAAVQRTTPPVPPISCILWMNKTG